MRENHSQQQCWDGRTLQKQPALACLYCHNGAAQRMVRPHAVTPHSSGGWSPRSGASVVRFSGEASPGSQVREQRLMDGGLSFDEGTNLVTGNPPPHDLITSQRPICKCCHIRASTDEFQGESNMQSRAHQELRHNDGSAKLETLSRGSRPDGSPLRGHTLPTHCDPVIFSTVDWVSAQDKLTTQFVLKGPDI